jgi:hypothetical protein
VVVARIALKVVVVVNNYKVTKLRKKTGEKILPEPQDEIRLEEYIQL